MHTWTLGTSGPAAPLTRPCWSGLIAAGACLTVLFGCSPSPQEQAGTATDRLTTLDAGFERILSEYSLATVGAGIIRDGELVWTRNYGEQAPGVPAASATMFNVASVTKTVTAELAVRLVARGIISLDESMSAHWIDPDLIDDPRHNQLTPRLTLTHRTGFPNWRYMDPEFRLRFIVEPGTRFGYSGEGMDYLARFLESKTGESFDDLVAEHVFEPMGLRSISITRQDWVIARLALPVDETGARHAPFCSSADGQYCLGEGEWSAADELTTTVADYARFMIGVMDGHGIDETMQAERLTVRTSTAEDPVLGCNLADAKQCPHTQGYGLGWEIFEFDDTKIVSHGGSDWSERAMAYFDPESRDGIVLFINGPASTSVEALIEGMRLLDPESKIAAIYQGWVDAYRTLGEEDSEVYELEANINYMLIRYTSDAPQVLEQIRTIWQDMLPAAPFEYFYVDQALAMEFKSEVSQANIFLGFAILTMVIGCLGLYGLAAFVTECRRREVGIRKILGASIGDILTLLLGQFSKLVLAANLIAWPVAYLLMSDWLAQYPFRISSGWILVFCLVAGLLASVVVAMTVGSQAWGVARANPINAIRQE